jgi:hypothetical protein
MSDKGRLNRHVLSGGSGENEVGAEVSTMGFYFVEVRSSIRYYGLLGQEGQGVQCYVPVLEPRS